jgi:anti-sigma B factor antagonist
MLQLSTFDDFALVCVRGAIDASMASRLRDVLSWAADHHVGVVVDLSGAPTIDPAGLAVLVRARTRARHRGGVLCVAAPSRYVLTVLHTMRVDGIFPTFADGVAAFSWLRRGDLSAMPTPAQAVAAARA